VFDVGVDDVRGHGAQAAHAGLAKDGLVGDGCKA
jgi:hypothetical protein